MQQHGHMVREVIGNHEISGRIGIQVSDRDARRIGSGRILQRAGEGPVSDPSIPVTE